MMEEHEQRTKQPESMTAADPAGDLPGGQPAGRRVKKTSRRRGKVLLAVAAALVLVCGLTVWGSYHRHVQLPDTLQAKMDLLPDANAKTGTPTADASETSTGENEFRIIINQTPSVQAGETSCRILSENPETNPYDLRICLYLKESGELLGASHLIQRGKRLDEMELNTVLSPGEYPIIAKLELFDEEQNPVNQIALHLTLAVRE